MQALDEKNMPRFLQLVTESGNSSAKWLQNLYSTHKADEQGISLALMLSERILGSEGACRVHGGGFAGTIQAFVPDHLAETYRDAMNRLFGADSCHKLRIREAGGIQIL